MSLIIFTVKKSGKIRSVFTIYRQALPAPL